MIERKALLVLAILSVPLAAPAAETADVSRLDEVARRGAQVMPFDLENTVHVFTGTERGGIQEVVAKDPTDAEQIRLVREHLAKIAEEFSRGEFADPARIHGAEMPGLAVLAQAKPGDIRVEYDEIENGGRIEYRSDDPRVVVAIHAWFGAQLSDHGQHAVDGSMKMHDGMSRPMPHR